MHTSVGTSGTVSTTHFSRMVGSTVSDSWKGLRLLTYTSGNCQPMNGVYDATRPYIV